MVKSFLVSAVVLITLSVGYYFVIFLPKNTEQKYSFDKQKDCYGIQPNVIKEAEKFFPSGSDVLPLSASNHFNSKLNKCFVSIYGSYTATSSDDGSIISEDSDDMLFDAYENNLILSCHTDGAPQTEKTNAWSETGCSDFRIDKNGKTVSSTTYGMIVNEYMSQ